METQGKPVHLTEILVCIRFSSKSLYYKHIHSLPKVYAKTNTNLEKPKTQNAEMS